jgi:hypothetical protein
VLPGWAHRALLAYVPVRHLATVSLQGGGDLRAGAGIFGLWFAIDPLPGEVWREFVVGENAGKMNNAWLLVRQQQQGFW